MAARILVVDDSATMRALHVYHLHTAGYETVQADSGFAALEVLHEIQCNLALVDVNMAHMDGFTLTRRIRDSYPTRDLPVILCTTLLKDADRERGLAAGADVYLTKPPNADALLESVRALLAAARIRLNDATS